MNRNTNIKQSDGVPIACRRLWNFLANFKSIFFTFFPIILFNQFRLFNFVFLIVDLSQFIPALKVGLLFTYIFMLSFVLSVTCIKEAFDDIKVSNNRPLLCNLRSGVGSHSFQTIKKSRLLFLQI
eukprot:GHVP01030072.1.p1 GENE.GHVP01030072.1~~GHVP01030072.1.p1  ORF type:complete len:125 (+),score=5.31 GHVP01030072.1:286-660(+)